MPAVRFGWSKVDAATICAARTKGAVGQLVRILGPRPEGLESATQLLARAAAPLRPEGKPLFAGLSSLGLPGDPIGDVWRLADLLREYRGDAHTAAWTSSGLDATEVGLLTELYWGLPLRTYVRTRAWSAEQLDAAEARLSERGLLADGGLTVEGRALRESVEVATDGQCDVMLEALGRGSTSWWPSSGRGARPFGTPAGIPRRVRTTWRRVAADRCTFSRCTTATGLPGARIRSWSVIATCWSHAGTR